MPKKKKNFDPLKYKKKMTQAYPGTGIINGDKSIYTHNKRKKPQRLGNSCAFFNKDKLTCKINLGLCKEADSCNDYRVRQQDIPLKIKEHIPNKRPKEKLCDIGVTAVVISDNRKCSNMNHHIQDILARLRISLPSGQIIDYEISAAYCEICDTYFILKSDFKEAKTMGIILCPIEDKTQKYANKTNKIVTDNSESRVHQLGYNVIKGNGYTNEQRHIVLANIIENTNISKHEITSNINRCITQHQSQLNYSESVNCWKNDLDFINSYKAGDIPNVKINKIIVGRR